MDDLISRQAAIDALIELTIQRDKWDDKEGFAQKRGIDAAICAIEDLPSAERHGRWVDVEPAPHNLFYATCSVCGDRQTIEVANYCPNCGASLRGEEK